MWRPLCKDSFNVAWWELPPYVYEKNSTVVGILPIIMKNMVHYCCKKQVTMSYDLKVANKVEAVEQVSNGTADFVLPLTVRSGKTKFLSFPHITIGKISIFFDSYFSCNYLFHIFIFFDITSILYYLVEQLFRS